MGVTFDDSEKKFVFDFEHDGAEDIVSLTGDGYNDDNNITIFSLIGRKDLMADSF